MARDDERLARSQQPVLVGGLPDAPGILAAIRLTPGLGVHLRGLADELLVNDFPGATLVRAEREMLATAVSAANDCFYCMDSHGEFATALLTDEPEVAALPWAADRAYPTHIDGQAVGPRGHAAYTGWVNAAGLPGLSVPAAPSREGLPIGLQLIGPYGGDDLLLELGAAYEAAAPWADRWPAL